VSPIAESTVRVVFLGDSKGLKKEIDDVDGSSSKLTDGLGKVGLAIGGAFAAGAVASFAKGAFDAAIESQKIAAQTEAVIKSTGAAAGVTAGQIGDLAGAISKKTGIDDEAIQKGQNLLLTFTNVQNKAGEGNDIFSQASKIMVDMGAAMGTDASGSAIQLGKALNDPVAGISALTRVGVTFTDAQKDQIKAMVEAGDTAGAQKVILAELSKEFGGSAEAQATASDKMKVALGNLQEQVGAKLLPIVERLSTWAVDVGLPALQRLGGFIGDTLGPVFAEISGGVRAFFNAFSSGGDEVTSSGFAGFLEGLGVIARNVFDWLRENVPPVLQEIGRVLTDDVGPALAAFGGFVRDEVLPVVADLATWIRDRAIVVFQELSTFTTETLLPAFQRFGNWIRDELLPRLASLGEWINTNVIPGLKSLADFVVETVLPAFLEIVSFIVERVIPVLAEVALFIIDRVIPVLGQIAAFIITEVIPAIARIVEWIGEKLIPIFAGIYDVVTEKIVPAVATIVEKFGDVISKAKEVYDMVKEKFDNLVGFFGSSGRSMRSRNSGTTRSADSDSSSRRGFRASAARDFTSRACTPAALLKTRRSRSFRRRRRCSPQTNCRRWCR
jgi:hypothetical protein